MPRRPSGRAGARRGVRARPRARHDTLAFFKLRRDTHYLFAADRRAFLGYRIEGGVLLVSGDPVGAPDVAARARRASCARSPRRAASSSRARRRQRGAAARSTRDAGLRALYIGDEAIVDTRGFSLEGRAIRKVRQSVSRLETAGYTAEAARPRELDERDARRARARLAALARRRARARILDGDGLAARRRTRPTASSSSRATRAAIAGFLHFVPELRPRGDVALVRCAATATRRTA